MTLIEARGLDKYYQSRPILKGVTLQINSGEVLALIGPRGAGKTTLLRLLDLLESPSRGEIYFNGVNVTSSERLRFFVRRRMSFVTQRTVVFSGTVADNIACGLKWRGERWQAVSNKVESVLELIGMPQYANRDARTLSVGETQLVALARALVIEPEVLFLDEPTANLDPVSAARVEAVLTQFIRLRNMTVVMATHDMVQGQRLAGRIAVIMGGQLLQVGEPRQIFCAPATKEVAEFVGVENILPGKVESNNGSLAVIDIEGIKLEAITVCKPGELVWAIVRPEDITFAKVRGYTSARNVFPGRIQRVASVGALVRIEVDCGFPLLGVLTKRSAEDIGVEQGGEVYVSFKATAVHVIGRQ